MACSCFSMLPERDLDSGLAEERMSKKVAWGKKGGKNRSKRTIYYRSV
jgi:hypothetical protein